MSQGENDDDWLQSFFPGWREEDQHQGNRNNGGPDQTHHQNPHPAFADAAQMAQAAHAAYVRFQESRSPQARAAQMSQPEQNSAAYSQGMDQTLFRSQLHRHSQHEQPQQQPQTQVQQQYQQQARQQALHLPQPQPYRQAQAQLLAQHQAREQAEQKAQEQAEIRAREQAQRDAQRRAEIQAREQAQKESREQAPQQAQRQAELQAQQQAQKFAQCQAQKRLHEQAQQAQQYAQQRSLHQPPQDHRDQLQQYYREAQQHYQAQDQADSRPQQDRPHQQYQYREASNQHQYVRPSDINPPGSYYQSNTINRSYTPLAPVRSPVPTQRSASGSTLAQPSLTTSQSPVEVHSRLSTGESLHKTYTAPDSHSSAQQSPLLAAPPTEAPPHDPNTQRNSTPQTTQQKVSETRPQTPPRARSQSQASSNQPEASRRGSFLEDAALFSTKSPQKDPYTSSSRSTLGPRANTLNVAASTANASAPTKPPSVSHSHPSPKQRTSAARPASVSVPPSSSASEPMTGPAQLRTSGSPPMTNSTAAAAASDRATTNRPPIGSFATFANIKSPAVPPVSYAVPQALRTYATPQILQAYAASQAQNAPASSQPSAQTGRSISSKPIAAPSTSTSGRNSPLSSQVKSISGPRRKKGRPPIYPDVVGPDNQSAGPGRAGDRWKVFSQTNPSPNGIPSQYQPVLSGFPVLRDPASASARAPAPPPSWRPPANSAYPASGSTPPLANRYEPGPSQSATGAGAISPTLQPTQAYQPQPAIIYTSGPVQPRPASTQPPPAKMRKLDDSSRQPVTPSSGTLNLGQYLRQSPSRRHITYRSDIIERMNSSDVLIKLEYDPATIARDILIVADKHPTEKSLNHHLHSLRQNFQAVDYSSDLASFRWDIVDPWVNYPPSVEQAASRVNQMPASSVSRLETVSCPPSFPPNLPPSFSGPTSPGQSMPHGYARDVPTAPLARPAESRPAYKTNTGITTTTGTANSSLTGSNLNNSDVTGTGLRTIPSGSFSSGKSGVGVTSTGVTKTNIGPSYPASSPALASTTTSTSTTSSPPKSTPKPAPTPPSAVDLKAFGALPSKPPSYDSPLRPTAQPVPYPLPSLPPASSPPRVYPSVPSSSIESHPPVSTPVSATVPAPAPKSSPKKSVKSTPVPPSSSSSAASRPLSETPQGSSQSPRGKAPRQSPLPKGLPEPQVVIPISPQTMAPPKKKPGRPPQKDIQVEVAIDNRPTTQYPIFKCKWTGCQAELHNLEAIHTHILAVHIPHHIVCAWDVCSDKNLRAAADMWEHVREKHMIPLAWQFGDGPSASATAADSYEQPELSGQGRQDTMTLPADRDSVKIFSRIHGTQTSKQKAELMEEGGRRWKEDAGPDTDTSDRPLSTPLRLMASSHTETAYTMSEVRVVIRGASME